MRRPLSSPMSGTLTRSRADIFVHRSRSGRVRPDPAGRKHLHDNPIHPSSLSLDVKHLREQERAVSVRCFPCMPGKIDHKDTVIKLSDGSDGLMSLIQDHENKDETFSGQVIRGESMQSAFPDFDILWKAEAVLDLESPGKACAEELVKASGERQHTADAGSDRLHRSTLKNKHIIAQCSRSKLYPNSDSFGYRRLLPYLSGIEKVSYDKKCSGCEEIIPPSVPSVKVEKEIDDVSMLINSVPLSALKDDIIESEVKPEQQTHDLASSNVNKMCELNPSSYVGSMVVGDSIGCLPGDVESEEKHVTQSSISFPETALCLSSKLSVDLCLALKDDGVELVVGSPTIRITDTLEDSKKLDSRISAPDPFGQNSCQAPMVSDLEMLQLCNSSTYSPFNSVILSIKELVGNTSDSQSSVLVRKEPLPMAPKLRRSGPGSHALTPRKNPLKKDTRLCSGVCTCLDCASFHLYADRSSEFSRRQLLDADDIVTSLMKELACLRKITEKSASPQVKEVCRNVLKVEQAAKSRMCHLIREMSIHCRLPGPRVKFADPIEEIRIMSCGKEDSGKW